jgi:hypothetical protein
MCSGSGKVYRTSLLATLCRLSATSRSSLASLASSLLALDPADEVAAASPRSLVLH